MQVAWLKLPRTWINLFFIYLGITTVASGLLLVRLSRNWMLSNWLTNYQGGFVRRGLTGEIDYQLGKLFHVTPVFWVMVFCFIFYGALLFSVRRLILDSSLNIWVVALLLSPATLSFQVLHPRSGFGKETILLAALALLAVLLREFKLSAVKASVYISLVMLFAVFAHEGNAFYGMYFFAVLVVGGRSLRQATKECMVPAVLAVVALWVCSHHTGSMPVAEQICSSLGYKVNVFGSSDICSGGAIPYLFRTREYARAETLADIKTYQYWLIFPFFALLALIPAIGESLVLIRAKVRTKVTVIWAVMIFSYLASAPLFYYAYDWGRWIYIHSFSAAILFIFLDAQSREAVVALSRPSRVRMVAGTAFVILYSTLWILPSSIEPLRLGYVGRVMYLAHFSKKTASEIREPIHF